MEFNIFKIGKHIVGVLFFLVIVLNINAQENKFTIEDFQASWKFYPGGIDEFQALNDGEHYAKLLDGSFIVKCSFKTGIVVDTMIAANTLSKQGIYYLSGYEFSPDEKKILLMTQKEMIYRRSFKAVYWIYDTKLRSFEKLSENGMQQLAEFSPDGNKIAFFRDNNLFIKDLVSKKEVAITTDGIKNGIINGAPDWVYEEEFAFLKAYCWSLDGTKLAYMRFDESKVKEFSMILYKGNNPELNENQLYSSDYTWKYPKAGEDNSVVDIKIFNLLNNKTTTVDIGQEKDQYIPRILWTADDQLAVLRLNRLQNHFEILASNPENGVSKVIYDEKNKYFIDEKCLDQITFLKDKKNILLLSERDGYMHVYKANIENNKVEDLTAFPWDVTEFYGVDEQTQTIFFQAADKSPIQRNVFALKIEGKKLIRLNKNEGYNEAQFSKAYKYFILTYSNITTPDQISLHTIDGKQIRILNDNEDLKETLKYYEFKNKEFIQITTSENIQLHGWILQPFKKEANKKYPVLMVQYSGPNTQEVLDKFEFGWEYLLAQKGYIVACFDGRGTGARGEEFRKQTYLQLGKFETKDQIECAKYLQSLDYIDKSRIGIWGWSFGGYIVASCLTKGAAYFKTGIAVAPVTNWRYYDNIYTERYMRKPSENPRGYDENSPIFFANGLKGNLLLIHGTGDDNVHFQNTAEFSEALVQANKQFDMQVYTNRNHGIYGGNTRIHLYNKMLSYILEKL